MHYFEHLLLSIADTGGNRDGTPPPPAIVIPPNPEAGGRSTNGLMWGKLFEELLFV
jgi:hypothetical protein